MAYGSVLMRQTELHLTGEDRLVIEEIRGKGLHQSREVNRAHVLSCLDRGIPEAQIMEVLGIGRTALWRTRSAYLQGGIDWRSSTLHALVARRSTTPMPRRESRRWPARRHPRAGSAGRWSNSNVRHARNRAWPR